jgi:hypothetical protein
LAAVAAVAVSVVVAVNSWLKDRGERQTRRRDQNEELRDMEYTQYEALKDQLDHLSLVMVGRPSDPETGIPAVRGFVDEQRAHNRRIDEELRTDNGGGTIKGSLALLRTQVTGLQRKVDKVVTKLGDINGDNGP